MIITCPECGEKTDLEAKICSHCGVHIKQCPKCGNVLKEGAKVCDYCGMDSAAIESATIEKDKQERKRLLDKQTEQYCKDYKKLTKPFLLLAHLVGMVGCIPYFCITVYKTFTWTSFNDLEEELHAIRNLFILSIFVLSVAAFLAKFRDVFACRILFRKMDKDKFDCQAYYRDFILPIENETDRTERVKLMFSSEETLGFLPLCLGKATPRLERWDTLRAFMIWIPSSLFLIAASVLLYNFALISSEHLSLYGNLDNLTIIEFILPTIIILVVSFIAGFIIDALFPFAYRKWLKKYISKK